MYTPAAYLSTTCDLYRPFGAGSPTTTGISCRLVPAANADLPPVAGLVWSHYIDLDETVDIRDGVTRTPGAGALLFADGDEVRIPNTSGTRYVVTWVVTINRGSSRQFKRAYLLRDTAVWPGP
jgi:hypothetical protein